MGSCKYVTTTLKLSAGEEKFSISSKRVIDPGFTQILTWQAVGEGETSLEKFTKGSKLEIKSVELIERLTSPPGYLTESELISLMERYGIGKF
jgi:DNA topoisomerase-3